ncbi:MAG: hypothetical protein ACRDT6_09135 [Micromonosporaceae bacterium]
MAGQDFDTQVRSAMFDYLGSLARHHPDGAMPSSEINQFHVAGRPMRRRSSHRY